MDKPGLGSIRKMIGLSRWASSVYLVRRVSTRIQVGQKTMMNSSGQRNKTYFIFTMWVVKETEKVLEYKKEREQVINNRAISWCWKATKKPTVAYEQKRTEVSKDSNSAKTSQWRWRTCPTHTGECMTSLNMLPNCVLCQQKEFRTSLFPILYHLHPEREDWGLRNKAED